jgi:phosphatidylglycerol:prolipoprotein diacylglycerol transferase
MYPRLLELRTPLTALHVRRPAGGRVPARPEARDGARESAELDQTRILDLGIYIIISALVGAKLLLLITDSARSSQSRELLTLAGQGGVLRGLILAVSVALWYIRRIGLPLWTTCDVFARALRSGTSSAASAACSPGAAYGKPTTSRGRSRLRIRSPLERRHAAQRSAAPDAAVRGGAEALILLVLLATEKRGRPSRDGRSGSTSCSTRSPIRDRDLPRRSARHDRHLLHSQFISLLLAPLAIGMLLYLGRRRRRSQAGAQARSLKCRRPESAQRRVPRDPGIRTTSRSAGLQACR